MTHSPSSSLRALADSRPPAPSARISSLLVASALLLAACGSSSKPEGKYPSRQPGCEVQVFTETRLPTYATENIGVVQASCDESVSDEECLRELKDQACKLGADTLWGVGDEPRREGGKKKLSGRAAHQK